MDQQGTDRTDVCFVELQETLDGCTALIFQRPEDPLMDGETAEAIALCEESSSGCIIWKRGKSAKEDAIAGLIARRKNAVPCYFGSALKLHGCTGAAGCPA